MSRSKDLADSAEVINFLDNISTDINSGLTSKLSISTNLSDLADADVALVNLGLTATATELNYTDGVTSNIQTQLDTKLASASYTASDVLTKVKTVDGAASGLDADLLDGQHGSYYTGYTDTAISNLVDSAPGALDTLNELAAALGDDANFSTTVTNSIALKAPLASPTFTGTVTADGVSIDDDNNYSFGDGTTYIQGSGTADRLKFITNASEAMRIDSSGNVGIGTTSPGGKLEIYGNNTGQFVRADVDSNFDGDATNKHTVLYISSSNTSDSIAALSLQARNTSNAWRNASMALDNSAITFLLPTATNTVPATSDERMRITPAGNVGIGTNNPVRPLQIGNNTGNEVLSIQSSSTSTGSIYFGDNIATSTEYAGVLRYSHTDDSMQFWTSSTERMRITSVGRIGIGTSSPARILHVENDGLADLLLRDTSAYSVGTGPAVIFQGNDSGSTITQFGAIYGVSNGSNSGELAFETRNSGSSAERMRIDSSGNVGIGTNSPAYTLDVDGDARFYDATGSSANYYFESDHYSQINIISDKDASAGGPYNTAITANGSNGNLELRTNGLQQVSIDQSGNVGIGTTSPSYTLDTYGAVASRGSGIGNAAFVLQEVGNNPWYITQFTGGSLGILYNGTSSANTKLAIDSSGSVGIGNTVASTIDTANGLGNLVVGSGSGSEGITIYTGTTGIGGLAFADGTTTTDTYRGYLKYDHSVNAMSLWTDASQRLIINNVGDVGIGTTTPQVKFEVQDNTTWDVVNFSSTNAVGSGFTINAQNTGVEWSLIAQGTTGGANDNNLGFHLTNAGTSGQAAGYKFVMTPAGRLGIGTVLPETELHVNGFILINNASEIRSKDTSGNQKTIVRINSSNELEYGWSGAGPVKFMGGGSYTERMRIHTNGNIGIGTTSPNGKLDIRLAPTLSSTTVNETADFADKFVIGTNASGNFGDKIPLVFNVGNSTGDHISTAIVGEREASGWTTALSFWTNNQTSGAQGVDAIQEKMRITGNGNVGIGTSTPSTALSGTATVLEIANVNVASVKLSNTGAGAKWELASVNEGSLRIYDNNAEKLRIDTSGNLLVGKTANNVTTAGVNLNSSGYVSSSVSSNPAAYFNRGTSDGNIAVFLKDGTTVGTIGVGSGEIFIGNGDMGIRFDTISDAIKPYNPSSLAIKDAAIDLGVSTQRFKDAHFSGTVNANAFAGDGSALTNLPASDGGGAAFSAF